MDMSQQLSVNRGANGISLVALQWFLTFRIQHSRDVKVFLSNVKCQVKIFKRVVLKAEKNQFKVLIFFIHLTLDSLE